MDIEIHLLTIADKAKNEGEAQNSMSFIYETFKDFVYNVIFKKIYFTLNKEDTTLIVLSDVFLHIWENPLDWEFDSSKHRTQEGGFKSYLSVVAKFKFLEELRRSVGSRENEENTLDDDDDNGWKLILLDDEFDYLDEELMKRRNLIDTCLSQFSERKEDIVRMYFLMYDDSKNMSSENILFLESMFETTWQNIRQIISRAKKDIKKTIQSKAINEL